MDNSFFRKKNSKIAYILLKETMLSDQAFLENIKFPGTSVRIRIT